MSLRLSFPTAAFDGRIHREEELTQARTALQQQQRNATPAALETPDGAAAMGSVPAAPPSAGRRRVVLPDPVAFKYASLPACGTGRPLTCNPLHRFLEGDSSVTVAERRRVLPGYEL